ncbi:MAG: cellulase family glycosylhydrolase, partial [Planctomycetota bacterium]
KLWDDVEYQDRTVKLWSALAERYADHAAVAAYDVVNEPFGDFKVNISPIMKDLFGRIHDAIREHDRDTLIYAPGTLQGIAFYGNPADEGWSHVGFTEHTYPGLFGWGEASLAGHARFLTQWVGGKARMIDAMDVPYLVGEFNVVFDHVGGPELMRAYFDTYASQGWASTMWAYKITKARPGVEPSNWYLATNEESFDMTDLREIDDQTLEARFRSLSTIPLAVDEALREALTTSEPAALSLPQIEVVFEASDETPAGWGLADVGGASPGGSEVLPDGRWQVSGGGIDIFNDHDDFRYVYRSADDSAALWTRLDAMDETDRFAKAGIMLRTSTEPDAAHALLHALPDGRVVYATRPATGSMTDEQTLAVSGFPVGLGVQRDQDALLLHFTDADGKWQTHRVSAPTFAEGLLGLAVLAHDEAALCRAVFAAPSDSKPVLEMHSQSDTPAPNLLQNASFETVENADAAADRSKHWNRWGHWLNRQEGWTPVRSGQAIQAYHHWQIDSADNSGIWQDLAGLTAGSTYEFGVYANFDPGQAGKAKPASVELRLEAAQPDGRMLTLASRSYPAADLASGEGWSRLTLSGQAITENLRVLLIVYPAEDGPRDGALKFDDVSLRLLDPSTQDEPS